MAMDGWWTSRKRSENDGVAMAEFREKWVVDLWEECDCHRRNCKSCVASSLCMWKAAQDKTYTYKLDKAFLGLFQNSVRQQTGPIISGISLGILDRIGGIELVVVLQQSQ